MGIQTVPDQPSAREKADAHDEFIKAVDEAIASLRAASKILQSGHRRAGMSGIGPRFPFSGQTLNNLLDEAVFFARKAHTIAAGDAYDYHREAGTL